MKGMVFTEFLEMVEEKFSPELVDQIIEECDLKSSGAYTAVGTYHHSEMVQLVSRLGEHTETGVSDLLRSFGVYLFGRFVAGYPQFFGEVKEVFDFLGKVDGYIHVEVRKLYPDAELPSIECETLSPDCMHVTYRSSRPLANLAEGLIQGCIAYYDDSVKLEMTDLSNGEGLAAHFVLTKLK